MEELSETGRASPIVQDTSGVRPYSPSFMDRLMGAVKSFPGPFWLPYLVLFLRRYSQRCACGGQADMTADVAWLRLRMAVSRAILGQYPD